MISWGLEVLGVGVLGCWVSGWLLGYTFGIGRKCILLEVDVYSTTPE